MLKIRSSRRVRDRGAGMDNRISGLHEKYRGHPLRIVAHLAGMGGVVAAHTIDSVHGKCLARSGDGDGWLRNLKQGHS